MLAVVVGVVVVVQVARRLRGSGSARCARASGGSCRVVRSMRAMFRLLGPLFVVIEQRAGAAGLAALLLLLPLRCF